MKRRPTNAKENAALITEDGRLRSFLSGGHVFRLNWIKSQRTRIDYFQISSLAEIRDTIEQQKIWLLLVPHKIYITNVGMQIINLEHPGLLSML